MMDLSTHCQQCPPPPKTVPDFFGIIVGKPKRRLIQRKNKVDGNGIQDHSSPDQRTDIGTNLTSSSIGFSEHRLGLGIEKGSTRYPESEVITAQRFRQEKPSNGWWVNIVFFTIFNR
ncbi:hypothetical protein AVEN_217717-1 [Araneus ventricosus]|uniref:Uncharacterized protein n=1 Tax=Araneus ventricosus TaxID=182803 RepID=A0A4Y2NP52_ARAVE|nr:hypothetical protein AVEN_217717-1 [Araneus ventricosus]